MYIRKQEAHENLDIEKQIQHVEFIIVLRLYVHVLYLQKQM